MLANVTKATCDRCGAVEYDDCDSKVNYYMVLPKSWGRVLSKQDLCPKCYKRYLEIVDLFFESVDVNIVEGDDLK